MAGYIRSKGQVLSRSQSRKSLQRINPTDHERRRADTVRVRNPIPYNAAYYGVYTVIKTRSFLDMAEHYLLSTMDAVAK